MTPLEEADELSADAGHDLAKSERLIDLAHEHNQLADLGRAAP
jgi:hypothetical protein